MFKFAFTFIAMLWGAALVAGPSVDDIRVGVLKGDMIGVETAMAELYSEALETGEFGTMRRVNSAVFAVTHADVISFLERWMAELPGSQFAHAGWAWNRYHIAGLYRGNKWYGQTSPDAIDLYEGTLQDAVIAAKAAYALAPQYQPASDAMLVFSVNRSAEIDWQPIFEKAIQDAPNATTLRKAIYAVNPNWGGSTERMMQLCADYADDMPNYDVEACIIQTALSHKVPAALRNVARDLLITRDEAWLDYLRLGFYTLRHDPTAVSQERLLDIHARAFDIGVSFDDYLSSAHTISLRYDLPFYETEAREKLAQYLDVLIERDPYNYHYLTKRIELLGNPDPNGEWEPLKLARAMELWQQATRFGWYKPEIWETGGRLAIVGKERDWGFNAFPYLNNAAAINPYPVAHIRLILSYYDRDRYGAERAVQQSSGQTGNEQARVEATYCPILRALRLFDAYCALGRGESECAENSPSMILVNQARDIPDLEYSCPRIATAEINELIYMPIPLSEFDTWWQENAPAQ